MSEYVDYESIEYPANLKCINATPAKTSPAEKNTVAVPSLSESRLKDLSWSLNIKDRTQMGVIDPQQPQPTI
jgi:hypothetical protein